MLYTLDADIVSLYLRGNSAVRKRLTEIPLDELSVPIVVIHELIAGWLPVLNRVVPAERYIAPYSELHAAVEFVGSLRILDFDAAVAQEYARLRKQHLRIGSNDLRIAAIARVNLATIVTRNLRDCGRVAGNKLEDWAS